MGCRMENAANIALFFSCLPLIKMNFAGFDVAKLALAPESWRHKETPNH
jgi:hypothetical protein